MEVSVERYQRKKYVSQENSPVLYYIRQKAGTAKIMDIDALAEDIQTNCALTTGDVKHTIEALVEQLRKVLTQGNKVKIEGLGTFHMTLTCLPGETEKECTVKNIKRVNVRFIPDKAMKLVNASRSMTRSPNNVTLPWLRQALRKAEEAETGALWTTRRHKSAPQITQIYTDLNFKFDYRENKSLSVIICEICGETTKLNTAKTMKKIQKILECLLAFLMFLRGGNTEK